MDKNREINFPHLILCEGTDDELFIDCYLKRLIKNGEKEFEEFGRIAAG